jgi:hypothetical protein
MVATFGRVGLIHKFLQSFCLILQFGLELGAMYVKIGKMLQDITPLEMDTYNSKIKTTSGFYFSLVKNTI